MKLTNEEKSDLQFKTLLIGKNGVSQIQLVLDQLLKVMNAVAPVKKEQHAAAVKKEGHTVSVIEYIGIVILVILVIVVIVLALNKFGVITLPFTMPFSWLNPSLAGALAGIL